MYVYSGSLMRIVFVLMSLALGDIVYDDTSHCWIDISNFSFLISHVSWMLVCQFRSTLLHSSAEPKRQNVLQALFGPVENAHSNTGPASLTTQPMGPVPSPSTVVSGPPPLQKDASPPSATGNI